LPGGGSSGPAGEPNWHALRDAARRSVANGIDETGWNVDARLRWHWVAVSKQVTFRRHFACPRLPSGRIHLESRL